MKIFLGGIATAGLLMIASAHATDPEYNTMKSDSMTSKGVNTVVDSNGDGVISKVEFTKYQDKLWNDLKKNGNGMVDASTWKTSMDHGSCADKSSKSKPMTDKTPTTDSATDRPPPRN